MLNKGIKYLVLTGTLVFSLQQSQAQSFEDIKNKSVVGLSGGMSTTIASGYTNSMIRGSFSMYYQYEVSDQFHLNLQYYKMNLGASRNNGDAFRNKVQELAILPEYDFLNIVSREYKWTPYVFLGIGLARWYRPVVKYGSGNFGRDINAPQNQTKVVLPFGAGIKYAINDNWQVNVSGTVHKLFDQGGLYGESRNTINGDMYATLNIGVAYRFEGLRKKKVIHNYDRVPDVYSNGDYEPYKFKPTVVDTLSNNQNQ